MSNRPPFRIKAYRFMIYVAAVLLVVLAILFSIARVLLDDMGQYRDFVEQQVSHLLNQRVRIEGFDARLEGITPVLIFKDVKLLNTNNTKELARFSEARIGLAVLSSIREKQLVPGEITINGIHIILRRQKSGSLSVQGLNVRQIEGAEQTKGDAQLAHWLFTYGALSLENSSIVWQDDLQDKRYHFNNVNLHLKNNGRRHVLTGQLDVPQSLGRDVKFSADIDGDSMNPQDWQGKFFVQAFAVNVKQWEQFQPQWNDARLKSGQVDVRLWGSWQQNHLVALSGDLSVYDLLLGAKKNAVVEFKLFSGMFDWQRKQDDWSLKLSDFQIIHQNSVWPKTKATLVYKKGSKEVYQVNADYLRLEEIHQLIKTLDIGAGEWRQVMDGLNPSGDIKALQAQIYLEDKKLQDFAVHTTFTNLSTSAWRRYPAVQGFQGELEGTLNYGSVKVNNQFSTLYFPKLFRRAFSMYELKTGINWKKDNYGWMLSINDTHIQTPEIKAQSNLFLHIPVNKTSPYMDLQVQFWDGDASQAGTYYPVGIMGKGLVSWLDQGIVDGDVSFGGAVFSGRLHDFPFRKQQGAFQVQFYADNVELDYQSGWPHLTNAKVDASFTGKGMRIKGIQASLLQQTSSQNVDVTIKDFLRPELRVAAATEGPTKEVFEFLVNSPIAPDARTFVESVAINGVSDLNLELYVPLNKEIAALKPLHYRGEVNIQKSGFTLLDKTIHISAVNGVLGFDELGLNAKGIKAMIMGKAANLDVYTQSFQEARPIQVVGEGQIDTKTLASHFNIPGLDKVSGQTSWQGVFTLPYKRQGDSVPAKLSLTSNLLNVDAKLPGPLTKAATETAAFVMGVEFPKHQPTRMLFQYKDQVQAVLALEQKKEKMEITRAAVNFGKTIPTLPESKQLRLSGNAADLPVQEWIKIFTNTDKKNKAKHFDWRKMPIELAMEGLHLRFPENKSDNNTSGTIDVLPQQWPLINGFINHVSVNETELGKIALDVVRERYGFNIKRLDLITPFSKVTASGVWSHQRQHETRLNLEMNSADLGAQLSQWGFAAIIKGGKVEKSTMQVSWDDSPFGFEFSKLKGSMAAYIEDGNIIEVNPGAGRLFGLLSLSALPRRLFLDFTDMKSGFSFDSVRANFDIRDGNATTKDLAVDSTLAKIVVDGRTGLSQQDYDLNVLVIPNISGTAPLPGYLVWGPQVGAVLLFFKQLFGKAFDKSVASSYRITGSWEKPVIEKVIVPENPDSE